MKKVKVFDDDKLIISTPDLSDNDGSRVAQVDITLNIYGKLVVSATNRNGDNGYWAESLDCVVDKLDNDTLGYLLSTLQLAAEQRGLATPSK